MLFFIIFIIICNTLETYNFIIQDTYNVLLKDNADYKVDLVIREEDYEMIVQNQLNNSESNKADNFSEISKLANKEYNETLQLRRPIVNKKREGTNDSGHINMLEDKADKFVSTIHPRPLTKHTRSKRDIDTDDEVEYNYGDLINEYYDETDAQSNNAYHTRESDLVNHGIINSIKDIVMLKPENYNCTESDTKGIGLKAIKCLWNDYKTQRRSTKDVRTCLWRIIKIWSLVYLVIAVPLWCTRGWCCCCLFCKFFKPRKTIEEARKYVLLNPPGVLKTKTGDVQYDATERERESYEEFEHFLRTL